MERRMGKGRKWRGGGTDKEDQGSSGDEVGQKRREGRETGGEGRNGQQVMERGGVRGGGIVCGGGGLQPRDRSSSS